MSSKIETTSHKQVHATKSTRETLPDKAKSPVKQSEKMTLIVAAAVMAIGALIGWNFLIISPLFVVLIILDFMVVSGSITSETAKRLIILFSILGAVVAVFLGKIALTLATGGIAPF